LVNSDRLKYGITESNMRQIARNVSRKMQNYKSLIDKDELALSNKNLSETVGKQFEREVAVFLNDNTKYQVINARSDKDPDIQFLENGEVKKYLEIKVTSTERGWTGGEFSKRPYDYLLISWGSDFNSYFIAYCHVEKKDWKSNIDKNYYGPSLTLSSLKGKNLEILLGSTTNNGNKLIRENIGQSKL